MTVHVVRIGVIGHGTVGAAFVKLVKQQSDTIAARSGVRLEIARVAVRNSATHAGSLVADVLTQDADFVVSDPTVDLVVDGWHR
jgi:homoserine dehydrogenase